MAKYRGRSLGLRSKLPVHHLFSRVIIYHPLSEIYYMVHGFLENDLLAINITRKK